MVVGTVGSLVEVVDVDVVVVVVVVAEGRDSVSWEESGSATSEVSDFQVYPRSAGIAQNTRPITRGHFGRVR